MTRILFSLAILSLVAMIVTLVAGLTIGNLYDAPSQQTLNWATLHRLLGVFSALAVVFIECVVMTYFIGTGRWCREVVETYGLDPAPVRESNELKRRTFPWALAGMLAVVGIVALGGAADPATGRPHAAEWVDIHLIGALAGVTFIAWTYFVAWNNIDANHAIIGRITAQVGEIRRKRGLDEEREQRSEVEGQNVGDQSGQ